MSREIEKKGLPSGGYKVVQFLLFSKNGFSDWGVGMQRSMGWRWSGFRGCVGWNNGNKFPIFDYPKRKGMCFLAYALLFIWFLLSF